MTSTRHRRVVPVPAHRRPKRPASADADLAELPHLEPVRRHPMEPSSLVALQRVHGNAHVQRVIARQPAPIQRDPAASEHPNDTPVASVQLAGDSLSLYKLYGFRTSFFNPANANADAKVLLGAFSYLDNVERKTDIAINVLETHEGAGKERLKTVESAAGVIGKRVADKRGAYSREVMEDYLDSIDDAQRDLRELGEKRKAIDIAISKVHEATTKKKKKEKEREVAEKADEVAEEEKWIEEQKKYVTFAIDLASKVVNPTEWVDIVVEAGVFIAKEIVDKNLSTDRLGELQKELAVAKTQLRTIEDEEIMAGIKTATLELDKARLDLANGKKDFLAHFEKIRRKEATVVEHLSQSKETKGAAEALKERGTIGTVAVNAEHLISHYLGESTEFLRRLKLLDDHYFKVIDAVEGAPQLVSRDPAHAEHLADVAATNRLRLGELKDWVNDSRDQAQQRLVYIGKGTFYAGYEDMPAALGSALRDRNDRKGGRK
jgi:hypothetical protein